MIEDKLTKLQIAKDDTKLDQYNIEAVTTFIRTMLGDLGETYQRSNIPQLKVLLGLVFPYGIVWDYNDTLNPKISPLLQAIRDFSNPRVPLGAGYGSRTRLSTLGR